MPTNLEIKEMIEKIASFLKDFLALVQEALDGLKLEYNGYESVFGDDAE